MRFYKGFTLVELLVVIAIIGILSSVAVINLNSSRNKAKSVSVLNQLSDLAPVIYLCLDNGLNLLCDNIPPAEDGNPVNYCGAMVPANNGQGASGSIEICEGIGTYWPNLEQYNWEYNPSFTYDAASHSWEIKAIANNLPGIPTINCTQVGCTKTGF